MYSEKQQKGIILAIIFILAGVILYSSKIILIGALWSLILYSITRPLHRHWTIVKKWRPALSALAILGLTFVALVAPFLVLITMIYKKVILFQQSPELNKLVGKSKQLVSKYASDPEQVEKMASNIQSSLVKVLSDVVNGTLDVFLQIAIMYLLLYFMLYQYKALERNVRKYLPFDRKNTAKIFKEMQNCTFSNLIGQGIIAFIQGSLVAIGFLIFDINDALFWGTISIFLSFLPLIGAPIVFVPAGIVEITSGNTAGGIGILIWGFVLVVNIDNILRYFIAKKLADVHPLVTIVGVVIGIPIFGILGIVMGPLLISYLILIVRIYEEQFGIRARTKNVHHPTKGTSHPKSSTKS